MLGGEIGDEIFTHDIEHCCSSDDMLSYKRLLNLLSLSSVLFTSVVCLCGEFLLCKGFESAKSAIVYYLGCYIQAVLCMWGLKVR